MSNLSILSMRLGFTLARSARSTSMKLLISLLAALCVVLGAAPPAPAQTLDAPRALGPRGQIALRAEPPGAPVELAASGPDHVGSFTIENRGDGPLKVTRVIVRSSPEDPRVPPGVSAELEGGGSSATLPPGASRKVVVRWKTAGVRARELYGHVVVESDAVTAGAAGVLGVARTLAMGIHAERGSGLVGGHILSIMTFLPLLGVVAVFLAHLLRYKDDRKLRLMTVVLMGVNLVLAAWLYAQFDRGFTRADGNDGYQFIEHGVWIRSLSVEYFVGVDGVSISMVLLTALISFVGALASYSVQDQLKGYFAMYNLLVTGMFGVFIALDLFLFFVFWEVMLLPMYFLIGIWGGPRREYAAIKFFLYTLAGSVFMLLAFIWFYLNAGQRVEEELDPGALAGRVDRAGAHDPRRRRGEGGLDLALHRVRHQDPDVPVPHLAAGRPRGGAHGDQRDPRRGAPQDGHLRHPPHQLHPAARCDAVGRAGHGGVRGGQHPLRRLLRHGAERSEEARRLLLRQPHGLHAAGARRDDAAGHPGVPRPDVQPRPHHGDALHPGRRRL
jgi:hypothetical protein